MQIQLTSWIPYQL